MSDDFIAPLCHEEIEIIFQDDDLLIINKPSGLLSLSGKNPLNKDSVHHRLVQDFPTATMVHRLDFGTSGLMVLALNKRANGGLTKQFQLRIVEKNYTAILYGNVQGDISNDRGEINVPIARADFPYQKICRQTGKRAVSQYQVLERLANSTRVMFTPITGRTHQLRVHSLAIGHPILGCDLYGLTIGGTPTVEMAKRLMLHATSLSFNHPIDPVGGERLEFESVCPF